MEHYIIQAVVRGRMSQPVFEAAIDTLPHLLPSRAVMAARAQGRSVLRSLTFLEFEIILQSAEGAHELLSWTVDQLLQIAGEFEDDASPDTSFPDPFWQTAAQRLSGPRHLSYGDTTFELLHAEVFRKGHDNQPQPIAPLLTPDVATNALRADNADTWRALLEPFKLFAPIRVGKLS